MVTWNPKGKTTAGCPPQCCHADLKPKGKRHIWVPVLMLPFSAQHIQRVCIKLLQSCPTLQPYGLQPIRLLCPWRFSRQEYLRGLLCPLPGNFPNPGVETVTLLSPAQAGRFFTTSATWEACKQRVKIYKIHFYCNCISFIPKQKSWFLKTQT